MQSDDALPFGVTFSTRPPDGGGSTGGGGGGGGSTGGAAVTVTVAEAEPPPLHDRPMVAVALIGALMLPEGVGMT